MRKADKVERIMRILDELYPMPAVPLKHRDPFTLLVAVVLSAQTTDRKVNEVTPALFARADTPAKMRRLSLDTLHDIIRAVGLAPQKARALQGLSAQLCDRFAGRVPRTFEELESLPGVGHKTAGVVLAQAFGVPTFPVDTHIHRLAARWGLSDGSSVERTERDLKRLFPEGRWIDLHKQIIFFGRERCPALRHDPVACRICSWAAVRRRLPQNGAERAARRDRRNYRRSR